MGATPVPKYFYHVALRNLLPVHWAHSLAVAKAIIDTLLTRKVAAAEHDFVLVQAARHAQHFVFPIFKLQLHELHIRQFSSICGASVVLG